MIKQRVLDELFDDPVLLLGQGKKKLNDATELDFTKNKAGLGDLYANDLKQSLAHSNPDAFLEQELAGPDGQLKREIEAISSELFQSLDKLANFYFTPKAAKAET